MAVFLSQFGYNNYANFSDKITIITALRDGGAWLRLNDLIFQRYFKFVKNPCYLCRHIQSRR